MPPRIVVTGAAGKLGQRVCERLAADGIELVGIDRQAAGAGVAGVELHRLDLRQTPENRVVELCSGAAAVIHLANHPSVQSDAQAVEVFSDNMHLNMAVFHAAVRARVPRLIFASSVQVTAGWRTSQDPQAHAGLPYLPADGSLPANPGNVYALSKHFGEQLLEHLVRHTGGSGVALRLPWLIDADDLRHLQRHPSAQPPGWQRLDEAFTCLRYEDAADLMAAILRSDLPGFRIYFPAAGDPTINLPIPQIIERWYRDAQLRCPVNQIDRLVDLSVIERESGWRPRVDRLHAVAAAP